ncbi:unnamed protein product, partial [Rotaria sp. Silwood2]
SINDSRERSSSFKYLEMIRFLLCVEVNSTICSVFLIFLSNEFVIRKYFNNDILTTVIKLPLIFNQ